LAWDAETKKAVLKEGETSSSFTFNLTNVSAAEVIINRVGTSCGCTAAELPEQPWKVAPGKGGPIQVTMNMQGKYGTVTKEVWVHTSLGTKTLEVTTVAPVPPPPDNADELKRQENMRMAQSNRQAVFRNDCASCHVEPGKGKKGAELYTASCGICHDSAHRASTVPDLTELAFPTDADFWRQWIKLGRPNSMMPAFAKEHGGPLDQEQVNSLVEHLLKAMPSKMGSLE
jgi:mono/diheme cytochrome c family protein